MRKMIRSLIILAGAFFCAIAPMMDLSVQEKLMPDAFDVGGYLYQAIGRMFKSFEGAPIVLTVLFLGMLWLLKRYLFHKPADTGVGEYLLCGFFALMQLLCTAMRQTGTIQVLYENAFQMLNAAAFASGMYLLLLCALRGLYELIRREGLGSVSDGLSGLSWTWRQEARHPFLFPLAVLSIAWLPQLIIRYPGQLTTDTVLQFHQYSNWSPRTTPHPPWGTMLYGALIDFGLDAGCMNLVYFAFTLAKTAVFLTILAYSLLVMHKRGVPRWIWLLTLGLYAVSPIYVGWTTVISKDSAYLILCMLAGTLLLEAIGEERGMAPSRLAALGICLALLMLVRHNGIMIALPILAVLVLNAAVKRRGRRTAVLALYAAMVMAVGVGVEEIIIHTMDIQRVKMDDWMSLPLQQTARVVTLHDDELPDNEKRLIGAVIDYDAISRNYTPADSDSIRWSATQGRTDEDIRMYLKEVWIKQLARYPADYLDASLAMNGVLFDLQSNTPQYISLTDNTRCDYVYQWSFDNMWYYNREELPPLDSLQRALTEWYFRFSELPVIGPFASMGFCMLLMLSLVYLCVVERRWRALLVMLPGLITGIAGLFCPIVYLRYLLPMAGGVPLWLAAFAATPSGRQPSSRAET